MIPLRLLTFFSYLLALAGVIAFNVAWMAWIDPWLAELLPWTTY